MRKFLNKIEFITITAIFFIFLFLFFTSENSFLLLDSNIPESTIKQKETPAIIIPEKKETPAIIIPEKKETPGIIIPEKKETPGIIIPEKKETPAIIIPEKKETPAIIIPEKKETPAIIAMTMAKIISENLVNSDFIFNGYEEKNWETSSMSCPKNGLFYQNKETSGYILESLINGEKTFYHINNEGEYINCTEINLYNNQSNLNFVEKFKLNQSKAIVLSIREDNKTLAVIDEKEEVTKIINSLNVNILNEKVEDCEALYDLTFLKTKENIVFNVFCTSNRYYVYNNEPFYGAELFINVLEPILSNISFPGLPNE